ncbi:MAG TPA: hypothetical protein VGL77_20345 [Armatimonadota bacterium]|jgi:predicted small metal-binding protein
MAWSYYCADEQMNIIADTKEELADKIIEHLEEMHDSTMTYDEAMDSINTNAKEIAA